MTDNLKITHENFVSIVKDLMTITDTILKNVVSKPNKQHLKLGIKYNLFLLYHQIKQKL